ncbi:unnamed protein product [Mytilus edulis]|uniref:Uncharacterized protein n=1 Tax=Mytilus edulis TaxID=6550 RepID=A0A8S3Q1L3_MYTED|nr:unnamed protein product [Mytilus edulis]
MLSEIACNLCRECLEACTFVLSGYTTCEESVEKPTPLFNHDKPGICNESAEKPAPLIYHDTPHVKRVSRKSVEKPALVLLGYTTCEESVEKPAPLFNHDTPFVKQAPLIYHDTPHVKRLSRSKYLCSIMTYHYRIKTMRRRTDHKTLHPELKTATQTSLTTSDELVCSEGDSVENPAPLLYHDIPLVKRVSRGHRIKTMRRRTDHKTLHPELKTATQTSLTTSDELVCSRRWYWSHQQSCIAANDQIMFSNEIDYPTGIQLFCETFDLHEE